MMDLYVFFFKQKTAYEMRISDWSSDVCSSDLTHRMVQHGKQRTVPLGDARVVQRFFLLNPKLVIAHTHAHRNHRQRHDKGTAFGIHERILDRQSVVSGKSVSVRVDPGGLHSIKKNKYTTKLAYKQKNKK